MPIVACGRPGHDCRCAPPHPLTVNPAEPVSLDVTPCTDLPMLVLPGGLRIQVDTASSNAEAAGWWHKLAISGLTVALFYEELARAGAPR